MTETWRNVENYNGYWVSDLGNVKSKRFPNRIMKPFVKKSHARQYLAVTLYNKGKKKNICIHRLVALNFIHNEFPKVFTDVHHKDNDTFNNRKDNLEWCTQSYNEMEKGKWRNHE